MEASESLEQSNALIDALGGNAEVARICGIKSQAVSYWRAKGVPRPWGLWLRLKFKKQLKAAGIV